MHKRIVETALSRLDADRASYFGDIACRLEIDVRAQSNANIVYMVLKDVMSELPIYLDKDELINLLLKFTENNYQRLHQIMFDRGFIHNPESIRTVTGDFIRQVVTMSLEKYDDGEIHGAAQNAQKLTWPFRDTDVVDPEEDPEEWAEALAKNKAWRLQHGEDRRRSGTARIDDVANKKVMAMYAMKKKTSD